MTSQNSINVLIIREGARPERKTIPATLEALQKAVDGYIEPFDLKGGATIYCNEEGKMGRWNVNRAIRASDMSEDGGDEIVEIMAGTFVITGYDPKSGRNVGLTDAQAEYWARRFHDPETIMTNVVTGEWTIIPIHPYDEAR